MEFPFGHHGHHHRRDEDDEERDPRYPAPGHHQPYPDAPPPQFGAPGHRPGYDAPPPQFGGPGYGAPPPQFGGPGYDAPPPQFGGPPGYLPVQHLSHENRPGYEPPPPAYGHGYEPPPPAYGHGYEPPPPAYGQEEHHRHHIHRPFSSSSHVDHEGHESYQGGSVNQQQTVRVFTKAKEDFALSIRDGKVVLAPANPRDEHQHWIKDMRYSTKVKDEEGLPCFALINKVTGEAIKHSIKETHPVRLIPYKPDYLDESVLWTESNDTGEGFRCIRMVNNIRLNFDAFHGDKDHGGVRDGTAVVLWEWLKGDNQRWKIIPY